ncbi:MAG: ATP-binding protein, partial [bacterium]
RESEDRFRGVVEGAAMPIFVTVEMKFSYLNPAALRLLGATTPEQVLGQPILSRIHPDCHESIQKRAMKVFQGQRGVAPPQEEVYLKLDGTPVLVEATASPITYQGQPAAVVFMQDITERKRLEEANTLLEAQFWQAQKLEAIGQLAGGIAHDFNNILAVILGNAELMVADTDPSHPARASLEEIQQASYRAKDLVRQILTYSRQQTQDRHVIALEPIIAAATKFLHAAIPSGVEIVLALAAGVPPVLGDATQIHQVIFNLCTNAWHAFEDQPGRISIQLQAVALDAAAAELLGGLRQGCFACLSVSDTGKGMDAAVIEHIFNPFFTTKAAGKGTGLGLSVVQGIVAAHDGAITVVSQPGQGTTFRVYFPAADVGTADAGIAPAKPVPQGQGQHVLFLDDEEALVHLATRMLERLEYRVTGFTQAAAAVQAFRANPGQFDVVITDLNMPGSSGMVVAREILAVRPDLPVLLCSGHLTETMKAQARSAGIRHVLYKPHTMEELSASLHQLVTEPRQPC